MRRTVLLGACLGLALGLLLAGCHGESERAENRSHGQQEATDSHRWRMHISVAKRQGNGPVKVLNKDSTP